MPGIVGIISDRPPVECESLVRTMVACMKHEPFYVCGTHSVPEIGIYVGWVGHENSFTADQVFFNEDSSIALVFSGECFVDPDTVASLRQKGHRLEKNYAGWLVHLYEEEGNRFFEKLNGLFSGLLIDRSQRIAFLFNDRYRVERIYWHQAQDSFCFSSEAKALLRVFPKLRAFNNEGVAQFLTYGCTGEERTLFQDIQLLPGASVWSFERGHCRKRKYFSPETWESQPSLSAEAFHATFQQTFKRVLPRYFEPQAKIGISLTGGLDTRMIMACRPDSAGKVVCYTFSGETGETFDDRIAAQVAKVCGLKHQLVRIGSDFFSDFASHVDRTVYVTDGCFGATGAHEIYLSQKARQLAPVRVTGNYGSEVLRGVSTFKPLRLSPALFNPEFKRSLYSAAGSLDNGNTHPITFAGFREIPWNLFGSFAAGRSQLTFRTPYLDNEIVALAYQAPESLRKSPLPAWWLVKANSRLLSRIPTDRRPSPDGPFLERMLRRLFAETTFKVDYLNNEGWPNWLSPFDPIFTRVTSNLKIHGLHKYLHYRRWYQLVLADYVQNAISDAGNQQGPFWNCDFLRRMAREHIKGHKNYTLEINAVLTLEAVQRLLMKGSASQQSDQVEHLNSTVSIGAAR
jgi:asparagine synthase (glutamine-hydrolysing)